MRYATDFGNIRINGTGRLYAADVGAAGIGHEVGEIDTLTDNLTPSPEKIKSNRQAGNLTIGTIYNDTEGAISFGARENTEYNLMMAYQAATPVASNQVVGSVANKELIMAEGLFVDVGYSDCYVTKCSHGTVTGGPFQFGETVTGGTSAATGVLAWMDTGFVELITITGTFVAGEQITGGTSAATAALSSVEKLKDLVMLDDDTTPTTRYQYGVDYTVDADYGFVAKMAGSAIGDTAYASCSYKAINKNTIYPMSNVGVEKKLTFVSDAGDNGPRMKITYFRVSPALNGDITRIGSGEAPVPLQCQIMADTSRPSGQQFMAIELFG